MKRSLTVLVIMLLAALGLQAQSTRIRGSVTDATTGEPIPFVSVYFEGTTIGISTDLDGRYSLETRSKDAKVLTASLIGYESQSFVVVNGSFSEVNFRLKQDISQLNAAFVKPDNRYIKSILKKIDQARDRNNPDKQDDWKTGVYSKVEIDATSFEALLDIDIVNNTIGFVKNYADTSAITGQAYIPIMISENTSDLYHSKSPSFNREVTRASRISGFRGDSGFQQYTSSSTFKTNFYETSLDFYDFQIPNPIAGTSRLFYDYYLVDSLNVDNRKTYVLRFHPKKLVTSPVFDGEMQIDAEDFGLRTVHAALSPQSNVNWLRHINLDVENCRTRDGKWFYKEEKLFMDLSITLSDSSKIASFLMHRTVNYGEPEYGPITDPEVLASNNTVVMEEDPEVRDEAFWESVRPYALTEREAGIYKMVDEIRELPAYKVTYGLGRMFAVNYIEIPKWKIEFGRWARTFAYNDTEGFRVTLGGRTLKDLTKKIRVGGYVAYGLKDRTAKGSFDFEWMLGRQTTRKLTFNIRKDYELLSAGSGVFSAPNVFSSIFAQSMAEMQSMTSSVSLNYDHEFSPNLNAKFNWTSKRIWGNDSVPLIRPDGTNDNLLGIGINQLQIALRISFAELVWRNFFDKRYLTSKYPIIYLQYSHGFDGITANDFVFNKYEAYVSWKSPAGITGFGTLNIEGGLIDGNVPYTMLKLHAGNRTVFLDKGAYSCMDYYEFISDRWLSLFYEHNFNGFFLGKIPLIKKLDLREVASVRAAWGTMSQNTLNNSPYKFLHQSKTLETPYVEVGAGIANIFRVFRVDAFWRLTNKMPEAKDNFAINIGTEIYF